MNERRISHPLEMSSDLLNSLRRQLGELGHLNWNNHFLMPEETSIFPEHSILARLQILKRVYAGDYHTDSFDISRLATRIRKGEEFVWFWGNNTEIDRLREYFHRDCSEVPGDLNLGTVSMIAADAEYGRGYAEICRSGSMDTSIGAKRSSLYRVIRYMEGMDQGLYDYFHTLTLTPRVRASVPGIRGGEAVHRLHSKYIKSRFLGFAPWYVMQGGVIEQLEYRELHRVPEDVTAALKSANGWYFSSEREANFAANLCEMSYGIRPICHVGKFPSTSEANIKFSANFLEPESVELRPYNPSTLICEPGEEQGEFRSHFENWIRTNYACHVVRLRLDNASVVPFQEEILRLGFKLTSISGPKRTWVKISGGKTHLELPAYGFWTLPNRHHEIAQPFYFGQHESWVDPIERAVGDYLFSYLRE